MRPNLPVAVEVRVEEEAPVDSVLEVLVALAVQGLGPVVTVQLPSRE